MTAERKPALIKPRGGNVSGEPFAQALYQLAVSRGYETQTALARALGKKHNDSVGQWYRAEGAPSPKEFGNLLVVLKPNDQELDPLADLYCRQLQKGKGISRGHPVGSESALVVSQAKMRRSESAIGRWIERFCQEKRMTLGAFELAVGLGVRGSTRERFGLEGLSLILRMAPQVFNLIAQERDNLSQAVAQTIEERLRSKPRFRFQNSLKGSKLKSIQRGLNCQTYNGQEAAHELGMTREAIRRHRKTLGLPLLLTEEQLALIKADLKKQPASS